MTNPVCVMFLNQDPTLEGGQLNKSKERRAWGEVCYNQCACPLIMCN